LLCIYVLENNWISGYR